MDISAIKCMCHKGSVWRDGRGAMQRDEGMKEEVGCEEEVARLFPFDHQNIES